MATEKHKAKILLGESIAGLLLISNRTSLHESEGSSTRHFISTPINSPEHGIIVEVKKS